MSLAYFDSSLAITCPYKRRTLNGWLKHSGFFFLGSTDTLGKEREPGINRCSQYASHCACVKHGNKIKRNIKMAKIITDKEMAEIIHKAVNGDLIDCADAYRHFLEDLAGLISNHFGGDVRNISGPFGELPWTASFNVTDCVPPDGGAFKDYDTDVTWCAGTETQD
jgi:hypothetical protein